MFSDASIFHFYNKLREKGKVNLQLSHRLLLISVYIISQHRINITYNTINRNLTTHNLPVVNN